MVTSTVDKVISELLKDVKLWDLFVLSRFLYRIGNRGMNDATYNTLECYFKANIGLAQDKDMLERTYDDDEIPMDLLEKCGLMHIVPRDMFETISSPYVSYLDEEKSMSILPIDNYEDSWRYFSTWRKYNIIISLKMDGVNAKSLYKKEDKDNELTFRLSLSRGRSARNGFNYTKAISMKYPRTLPLNVKELKVFAEVYIEPEFLPELRSKYGLDSFKTAKSSAISLLRVTKYPVSYYEKMHAVVHDVEGLSTTYSDNYITMEKLGFETVPFLVIHSDDIPETFQEFKMWLKSIFDTFDIIYGHIPADGLVCRVDNNEVVGDSIESGKYASTELALKFEQYKSGKYKGKITSIIFSQRRVQACCKVRIEPVLQSDMCTATTINCFNPGILINNGLRVGTEISFEKIAGAVNIYKRDKVIVLNTQQ